MLVTVDTNIVYSALMSRRGVSYAILSAILSKQLDMALSVPLFIEYEAVLKRPKSLSNFGLSEALVDEFLDAIAAVGYLYKIHYRFRPNLRDEADNMLVELALTSNSRYLITGNIRDFTIDKQLVFDDLHIVTPRNFWLLWRSTHEQS